MRFCFVWLCIGDQRLEYRVRTHLSASADFAYSNLDTIHFFFSDQSEHTRDLDSSRQFGKS